MQLDEFLAVMKQRRTVRSFKKEPVPPLEVLRQIMEAACYAPYAGKSEPWKLILVRKAEVIHEMAESIRNYVIASTHPAYTEDTAYFATYFEQAPLVLAAAWKPASMQTEMEGDSGERGMLIDPFVVRHAATIGSMALAHAIQNVLLGCTVAGLATGYVGPFHGMGGLEKILGVEKPYIVSTLIPIGYASEGPGPRKEKDMAKMIKVI